MASTVLPRIVVTAGEPAGIGLDLCVMLAQQPVAAELVIIADQTALIARAKQFNLDIVTTPFSAKSSRQPHRGNGSLQVMHIASKAPVEAGKLDVKNSAYVLETLACAVGGCMNGEFDAMVTAPVHKGIINDTGIAFTGHTEYLAELTQTDEVVMLLVGAGMRVALVTRHLALTQVSASITEALLSKVIRILHADLIRKFGISHPRILVAGLNPHAGEGGYLGDEEIKVINPTLDKLRAEGINLVGALPADTMFSQKNIPSTDAFLAMYHDQGLAVLKHASFGGGVNVTLGLPIIRTSVDHGTALDLAGSGKADCGSLLAAIELAIELAERKAA